MNWNRGGRGAVIFAVAAMTLLATGCSTVPPGTAPTSPFTRPVPTRSSDGTPAPEGPEAAVEHIVVIVEENHSASNILDDPGTPFINRLAAENAVATNYHAVAHPSLPNYLALTSGTTAGITDDCDPGSDCTARVHNITDAIEESGRTWKMYAEGMPAPCTAVDSGRYAARHNPFMYFPGVTGDQASCAQHDVPFTQLAEDLKTTSSLPNYVFISPDTCNDMHDCPVATGDAWLAREVPRILESPAFTQQDSLLVLTWDEDDHHDDNRVLALFAGPAARPGHTSSRSYNHYSLLHTVEELWGLPPMTGNDRRAPVMGDMLR